MKKLLSVLFALVFMAMAIPVLAAPTVEPIRAGDMTGMFANSENVTHSNGSTFMAGQDVTVDTAQDGSVVIAGQFVNISADINGDAIIFAQTVDIGNAMDGVNISGNLYVFAQTVTVSGTNFNDIAGFAQKITINGSVARDVNVFAASVNVDCAPIRNLNAFAGKTTLGGNIIGNAISYSGTTTVNDGTVISGALGTLDNSSKIIAGNAKVGSYQTLAPLKANKVEMKGEHKSLVFGLLGLFMLGSFLLIWVLFTFVFKKTKERITVTSKKGFWWQLLSGLILAIGAPIVMIIACLTFIGIPIGIILGLLLAAAHVLANYLGVMSLSEKLGQTKALKGLAVHKNFWLTLIVELLALLVLAVPVLNIVSLVFFNILGLGVVVNIFWKKKVVLVDNER